MYAWLVQLLQPYTLLVIACLLATVAAWRSIKWRHQASCLAVILAALLLTFSLPVTGYFALGSLEWAYPRLLAHVQSNATIVVLSGSQVVDRGPEHRAALTHDSIQRCLYAAELYEQAGRCRIVVAGGKVDFTTPGPTLADTMQRFLVRLGVAERDILLEDRSSNTHENALYCKPLLQDRNQGEIYLVTNAAHMIRAAGCFRAQGVSVTPAPCDFHASELEFSASSILPTASGIQGVNEASHEWLGLLWYWLRGRI